MKRLIPLGLATIGSLFAYWLFTRRLGSRVTSAVRRRMIVHMERMMASLPEGAPPKLVMSILPKLQAQNDQIITMLQEQNELLREQRIAH